MPSKRHTPRIYCFETWDRSREIAQKKDPSGKRRERGSDNQRRAKQNTNGGKRGTESGSKLIWLVTRCRPDITYATSLMSTLTTRKPLKVMRMAYQVWCYLAGTLEEGLVFRGTTEDLVVYTDASFGEEDAHGCVV